MHVERIRKFMSVWLTGILECISNFSSSAKTFFNRSTPSVSSLLFAPSLFSRLNIWGSKISKPPRGCFCEIYSAIWLTTQLAISKGRLVNIIQSNKATKNDRAIVQESIGSNIFKASIWIFKIQPKIAYENLLKEPIQGAPFLYGEAIGTGLSTIHAYPNPTQQIVSNQHLESKTIQL